MFDRIKNNFTRSASGLGLLSQSAYSYMFGNVSTFDCEEFAREDVDSCMNSLGSHLNAVIDSTSLVLSNTAQYTMTPQMTHFHAELDHSAESSEPSYYAVGMVMGAVALLGLYCARHKLKNMSQSIRNWWNNNDTVSNKNPEEKNELETWINIELLQKQKEENERNKSLSKSGLSIFVKNKTTPDDVALIQMVDGMKRELC